MTENNTLIEKLAALVVEWEARAQEQIPAYYKKRGMGYKYLCIDNEAAGLSYCADELHDVLEEAKHQTK